MYNPSSLETLSRHIIATGKTVTAQSVVEMINGGVKDAKLTLSDPITSGDPVVFESATTNYKSATTLSPTKVLVVYTDVGNSYYGTAIVLNITANVISTGVAFVFSSYNTAYISATTLSSTKVLVTYSNSGGSSVGTSIILNIATNTVTAGTPLVFSNNTTLYISCDALSSTKAVATYRNDGNSFYGTAIVLNISTDTITSGTAFVFESATTNYSCITTLNATKSIVGYQDAGNSNYGTSIVLSISTDTITAGSPVVFESSSTDNISITKLTEYKTVLAYSNLGSSGLGTSRVLNISNLVVTFGSAFAFTLYASYISVKALSATKVMVAYKDNATGYGNSMLLSIATDTITGGTAFVFSAFSITYIGAVFLESFKTLLVYTNGSNSNYGTSIVLNTGYAPITNIIGIAKQSGVAGETVLVSYGDEIGGFTGLTQGSTYYLSDDGTLSLVAGTYVGKVAIALSTTKVAWLNPIV